MKDWDSWVRVWGDLLDGATQVAVQATEQWLAQTVQEAVAAADAVAEDLEQQINQTLEPWMTEWQRTLEPLETVLNQETEQLSAALQQTMGPLVTPLLEATVVWVETLATPVNQVVDPLLTEQPACMGCRHYYGQIHGGQQLVCAMHPYGPETEACPDYEGLWDASDSEPPQ